MHSPCTAMHKSQSGQVQAFLVQTSPAFLQLQLVELEEQLGQNMVAVMLSCAQTAAAAKQYHFPTPTLSPQQLP